MATAARGKAKRRLTHQHQRLLVRRRLVPPGGQQVGAAPCHCCCWVQRGAYKLAFDAGALGHSACSPASWQQDVSPAVPALVSAKQQQHRGERGSCHARSLLSLAALQLLAATCTWPGRRSHGACTWWPLPPARLPRPAWWSPPSRTSHSVGASNGRSTVSARAAPVIPVTATRLAISRVGGWVKAACFHRAAQQRCATQSGGPKETATPRSAAAALAHLPGAPATAVRPFFS